MTKNQTLITAAGGNGTAIEILDQALTRQEYESRGKALESDFVADGVEQAGFLIPSDRHFEMAGGEFCGNATRSAAVALYERYGGEIRRGRTVFHCLWVYRNSERFSQAFD